MTFRSFKLAHCIICVAYTKLKITNKVVKHTKQPSFQVFPLNGHKYFFTFGGEVALLIGSSTLVIGWGHGEDMTAADPWTSSRQWRFLIPSPILGTGVPISFPWFHRLSQRLTHTPLGQWCLLRPHGCHTRWGLCINFSDLAGGGGDLRVLPHKISREC